jgi:crotonobetainyl-CoA:carnitine CoA-transferase CaiB-like acyl-CoA transferase
MVRLEVSVHSVVTEWDKVVERAPMAQALSGISVAEIGEGVALGYCAKLFADLGASVIKVESAEGDPVRRFAPFAGGRASADSAAQHLHLNSNKRSVVVEPDRPDDLEFLRRIVARADLVIESTAPGTLERWNLGWDTLHVAQPDLVMTSITGFGQHGPYSGYRSNELISFAMGGAMTSTGDPEREPVRLPGDCHLYFAGNVAAVGALAGLRFAGNGGGGTHVDVSVMETLLSSADWRAALLLGFQFHGVVGRRQPSTAGVLPTGIFPCADGYVSLMTALVHAQRMTRAMDNNRLSKLFADPNNVTTESGRDAMEEELFPWLLTHTKAEITAAAQAAGWPGVAINTPAEVVSAEHFRVRQFFNSTVHPVVGPVTLLNAPYRFEHGGPIHRFDAPSVGEHTAEVAAETLVVPLSTLTATARTGGASELPLVGIRVIDLSIVWAGPFVTQFLADLGAEVLRVENPFVFPPVTKGVMPRPTAAIKAALGPLGMGYANPVPGLPDRPYNRLAANNAITRNKRSFTVDLRREEGREIIGRLLGQSDVLVENFAAGTLEKVLGQTPAELLENYPGLIILRLPPFGLDGPWSEYTGFGAQFEAMSGFTSLWGYADSDISSNSGTAYLDGATGPAGAFAVLAALEERAKTGRGQVVELAQSENLMQHIGESLVGQASGGGYKSTMGNRDHRFAPQGVYPCAGEDRWIAVSVADDEEWRSLAHAIGGPDLVTDSRFTDLAGRTHHHDLLDGLLAGWTADKDHYEVFHLLQLAGVTAGPVLDESMVFTDPHVAAREFFRPATSRDTGTHLHPGHPYSGVPLTWWRGAPALGEDNEYVYRELLGVSDDDYKRLEHEGHISQDYVTADGVPL